jgi:hypothetical protein
MSPLRRLRLFAAIRRFRSVLGSPCARRCRRLRLYPGVRWPHGGHDHVVPGIRAGEAVVDLWMYTRHAEGRGFESTQPLRQLGTRLRRVARRHQSGLVGKHDRLDAVPCTELAQYPLDVGLDGRPADHQLARDLAVGQAASHQL